MPTSIKDVLQENISSALKEVFNHESKNIKIEHPSNEAWGDFASSVAMVMAKELNQSPEEIANKISYRVLVNPPFFIHKKTEYKIFEAVSFAPPGFINITLSKEWLQSVLHEVIVQNSNYGSNKIGNGKTILVEFSQPNPNKAMHIGHARNNFLGTSVSNLLSFMGYKVIRANYVNDWGVHICQSMLMYQKFGEGKEPNKKPDHFVGEFYAMFQKEVEKDKALEEEARELFRKLENKDKEALKLWEKIVNWVYEGWKVTYAEEKVEFDIWQYQHYYADIGKEVAQLAIERGIAEKDETGAIVARLKEYDIPDKVLLRSDGTSIYSTQDLQLAKDSFEKYKLYKRLYVVDYRQSDYFKQIFKILEILGFPWAKDLHHVSYGVVDLPEGHMSSRKGLIVSADSVLDNLIELEQKEVTERKAGKEGKSGGEEAVKEVALAAFKYPMLKVESKQNIVFDSSLVTKFEGDTGPYIQYTFARANSVLAKAKFDPKKHQFKLMTDLHESELKVLRSIYKFPEVVEEAGTNFAPSLVCNYLFDLASRFNSFYTELSVMGAENENTKHFRLYLCASVTTILRNGLALLGIDAPETM